MSQLKIVGGAFADCVQSGRLWAVQIVGNVLLFLLFVGWLLIPVANNLHLIFNFLFVLVLLGLVLTLHAGTFNYFSDRQRSSIPPLWPSFRRALRHLLSIAVCIVLVYLLWLLVDKLETYQVNFPPYVRSTLPAFLRRHVTLHALDSCYVGILFLARWVLAPGLLLPFILQTADRGFRGFCLKGLVAWRETVCSSVYWLALIAAALLGVLLTQKIMAWTPDFRTSTFHSESFSLAWRILVAYLLGLISWMFTISTAGRYGFQSDVAVSTDLPGNPVS
ncbi:MAG TPA: hypothetical protein VJN93_08650 [Candidatus Acidoferrum sp.]|nr:hypothetical protein [Candidatus Acidoferrum sp.]